jgi:hypothetical protein
MIIKPENENNASKEFKPWTSDGQILTKQINN